MADDRSSGKIAPFSAIYQTSARRPIPLRGWEKSAIPLDTCPALYYNWGMKRETHFRLTETARALLARLAEADGISQNAVMELLIREAARKRGIRADSG